MKMYHFPTGDPLQVCHIWGPGDEFPIVQDLLILPPAVWTCAWACVPAGLPALLPATHMSIGWLHLPHGGPNACCMFYPLQGWVHTGYRPSHVTARVLVLNSVKRRYSHPQYVREWRTHTHTYTHTHTHTHTHKTNTHTKQTHTQNKHTWTDPWHAEQKQCPQRLRALCSSPRGLWWSFDVNPVMEGTSPLFALLIEAPFICSACLWNTLKQTEVLLSGNT